MSNYSKKKGMPPGSLVFTGKKKIKDTSIDLITYNLNNFSRKEIKNINEFNYDKNTNSVYWLNVNGLHNTSIIEEIGKILNINSLILEDILNTGQRPKTDFFDNYIYVTLKILTYNEKTNNIINDQISILFGSNYVVTFQERHNDMFDLLKSRLEVSHGKARSFGSDYLTYSIIDIIIDNYFVLLEKLSSEIESLEEELTSTFDKNTLNKIYFLKRENLKFRNSVWPLREVISRLEREDSNFINDKILIYFRDLYDHTVQIIDNVETYRDILSGMIDLYLSGISNRTNEVMKVLTIISTIFIPLTFIVGVYGMNFKFMPELELRWGYLSVWVIMIMITIFMIIFIKKRKWL